MSKSLLKRPLSGRNETKVPKKLKAAQNSSTRNGIDGGEGLESPDSQDDGRTELERYLDNKAKLKGKEKVVPEEPDEDSLLDYDSEVNEFEQDESQDDDESDEGSYGEDDEDSNDNLIDDDGEDLMATMNEAEFSDKGEGNDSDSQNSSASSSRLEGPTPKLLPLKKANVRNSRGAPTLSPAELRALAFAELTASPISSIISVRTADFLKPLSPPSPTGSLLQPLLKQLHSHLTNLPDLKPKSLKKLAAEKGARFPKLKDVDGKWGLQELAWTKPKAEAVRVIGRWAWGGGIKIRGEYIVDIAIAMPSELLQPKDYLSPRFAVKSMHYLATIDGLLPKSLGPVERFYVPLGLSRHGWALELRSADLEGSEKTGLGKIKGAVLRFRVVWPAAAFSLSKLSPLSNIVRPISTDEPQIGFTPTPTHTSSLICSSLPLLTAHLKFHHTVASTYPSYTSIVRLLQYWATKRSFMATLGPSDEWWAWCVARTLNWGASKPNAAAAAAGGEAWAGWRKTVEWLASVNWVDGVFFRVEGEDAYDKESFRQAYKGQPIFVDPTGTINLAAGIDLATLDMLKHDAQSTMALMLSQESDEKKFDGALTREIRIAERFDNFAHVQVSTSLLAATGYETMDDLSIAFSATLRRAVGSRTKAFQISGGKAEVQSSGSELTIGMVLKAEESKHLVDQGPAAEDENACNEFRAFWGSKAELRRFKDGRIVECVVWDEPVTGGVGLQRSKIVAQILTYILKERHGIPASCIKVFAGDMEHLLLEPDFVRKAIFLENSTTSTEGFINIISAYEELAKELKALPDLPLEINGVQPSSPALRYSSLFVPKPRRLKNFGNFPESTKYIEVHDIILTLEGSGRWPDDLEGIQKIKAAFLAKIAEGLISLRSIVKADVVFDLDARTVDDNVSLEILTVSGYSFRARVFYERSLLLLQERVGQLGEDGPANASLRDFERRFVHTPRHHAAISTLQHHFTSYSPTVRLVKRWFSAHILSSHVSKEHIELMTASVFLDPASPYDPPNSDSTGFARVMDQLARWKWRDEPLLIPLYTFSTHTTSGRRAMFPSKEKEIAVAHLQTKRLAEPGVNEHAWLVCTEEDCSGDVWGQETSKVVAARVKSLALATLRLMEEGVATGLLEVETLFTPPLGDYNFLIHLERTHITRYFESLAPDSRIMKISNQSTNVVAGSLMGENAYDSIRLGWDPVEDLVQELKKMYPTIFLLFYSSNGAPVIGGIWNPAVESSRPWKIGLGFPCKPVQAAETGTAAEGKMRVIIDKEALFQDIKMIGKGLIKRIEVV